MDAAVIIMARAPYMGWVKRRLAKDIGLVGALRLYRKTLALAIEASRSYRSYLALTPDGLAFRLRFPMRAGPRLTRLRQGFGDLGQRMERLARYCASDRCGSVIFIGSDSLVIRRAHIAAAQKALRSHAVVIAPAGDGGYSLIGMRNSALLLFRSIRWSSQHTLEDTLLRIKHKSVYILPELPDIDRAQDFFKEH